VCVSRSVLQTETSVPHLRLCEEADVCASRSVLQTETSVPHHAPRLAVGGNARQQAPAHRPRRSCLRSSKSLTAEVTRMASAAAHSARQGRQAGLDDGVMGGAWTVSEVTGDPNLGGWSSGGETSEDEPEMERGRGRDRGRLKLSRTASAPAGTLGRVVTVAATPGYGEPGGRGVGRRRVGQRSTSVSVLRAALQDSVPAAATDSPQLAQVSARDSHPALAKGVCPRLAGWLVCGHKRVRVSYLVDSGASDCFVSPAVAQLVQASVCAELGPQSLQTAGKERVQCRGVTTGVTTGRACTSTAGQRARRRTSGHQLKARRPGKASGLGDESLRRHTATRRVRARHRSGTGAAGGTRGAAETSRRCCLLAKTAGHA
jgi:hypothetical protein